MVRPRAYGASSDSGLPLALVAGGTGADNARQAMAALKGPYILAQSGDSASHTGDTNETTLATITVPAGAMGANGAVRITLLWTITNSANTKTLRAKFGGTAVSTLTPTTSNSVRGIIYIANRNATDSQVGAFTAGNNSPAGSLGTAAIDTAAAVDITLTGQLADSGESIALDFYLVELLVP